MSQAYAQIQKATDYIRTQSNITPKLMLVLGSGLGDYGNRLQKMDVIPYQNIPGFPRTTVPGHKGNLLLGELFGVPVVIMQGRFHYYEGHRQQDIAFPVRVLRNLGAQMVLFTNAAGAINMDFKPGDLMMITDHINYSGMSPLFGENVDEMGPRFIDMTQAYDKPLQQILLACAREQGISLKQGVYMMFPGPQFETPAEIRFARTIGADAAGMSTVPEIIAARHCGLRICAISCMTNMAAGILDQPLSHEEVMETGRMVSDRFARLVDTFIQHVREV